MSWYESELSEQIIFGYANYGVPPKLDSKNNLKQLILQLRNVQQWQHPYDAATMPTSRPNGAARAVVLEALKGTKTLAQLSSEFGIHSQMITDWKRQALDGMPSLFESTTSKATLPLEQREQIEAPLFQQIGQLKVENDWLKKNYGRTEWGSAQVH